MNKRKAVRIVDLPDFESIKGESKGETLLNLYLHLKPEDFGKVDVDVRKIRMNYDQLSELIGKVEDLFENHHDKKKVGLMWMNQGPAGDCDLPQDKVYLYEGYMTPAK